ncbi:epsin-1 [Sergentomyia squamirostris]
MQVNVAGIRRNIKNLAHNYSDAQVKVREATSNDPWGPSATLMAEIADLTYNVVAYSEIMAMIWKRLNDHGKNWRHVYKALILLEYLIKTGTEKVAQQCKENVFAIQTLRDFQYLEEGKDQGLHVREKAKLLVTLLKDDERLKNERTKALKAKERFAQHASGFGSDGSIDGPTHRDTWHDSADPRPVAVNDIEFVRPQTVGEEELQLQLAMAMSREEAEQEEAKRRSDDVRLQLALSQSEQDFKDTDGAVALPKQQQSHLMDLLDISLGATSISSPPGAAAAGPVDPWAMPQPPSRPPAALPGDPWSRTSSPPADPWSPVAGAAALPLKSNPDGWLSRNESPSVASGSSTEGWLNTPQSTTTNGNLTGGGGSSDPWSAKKQPLSDPWQTSASIPEKVAPPSSDPWQLTHKDSSNLNNDLTTNTIDPWAPAHNKMPPMGARPSPVGAITSPSSDLDEFDIITNRSKTNGTNNNNSSLLEEMDPLSSLNSSKPALKTPQSFLGENSSLVNLDNLIKLPVPNTAMSHNNPYNPFSDVVSGPQKNAFQQNQPVPSINQLKQTPFPISISQDPWTPVSNTTNNSQQSKFGNPFKDDDDDNECGDFQVKNQPNNRALFSNGNNLQFYQKFNNNNNNNNNNGQTVIENEDSDQDNNFYFNSRCKKLNNNVENYFSNNNTPWRSTGASSSNPSNPFLS